MKSRLILWAVLVVVLAGWAGAMTEETLRFGPFGPIRTYRESPVPAQVVLFVSGDGGWNLGVVDMARSLAGLDALVVGVDITHYLKAITHSDEACIYPAGDLELLSKYVQQVYHFPRYVTPVLVGYSSGATLVYTALVEAPADAFRGGLSLGFCPDLVLGKPPCKGGGLTWVMSGKRNEYIFQPAAGLEVPWIVFQGIIDQVCDPAKTAAFVRRTGQARIVELPRVGHGFSVQRNWMPQFRMAFAGLTAAMATPAVPASAAAPPRSDELKDLPLEEVPATGPPSDFMVLHLTGDGGWGVTDKGLSRALAAHGMPVVGLNSLHYFWKAKTPETTAADVTRILRHYLALWHKDRIILVGYSMGADVLPFVVNRLPDDLRQRVRLLVFLGLSGQADFEFHLSSWLGASSKDARPVLPELARIHGIPILCVKGARDSDAICPPDETGDVTTLTLAGGHRIGSDFSRIVTAILAELGRKKPSE